MTGLVDPSGRGRWHVLVRGTVQGVGVRPFVHRVATRMALDGTVRNLDGIGCHGTTVLSAREGLGFDAGPHPRRHRPEGREAVRIGTATGVNPGRVVIRTGVGSRRVLDMLVGEQLPRIC